MTLDEILDIQKFIEDSLKQPGQTIFSFDPITKTQNGLKPLKIPIPIDGLRSSRSLIGLNGQANKHTIKQVLLIF
jgi:hypothetical protein